MCTTSKNLQYLKLAMLESKPITCEDENANLHLATKDYRKLVKTPKVVESWPVAENDEKTCFELDNSKRRSKWAQTPKITTHKPFGLCCRVHDALCAHQSWGKTRQITYMALWCCVEPLTRSDTSCECRAVCACVCEEGDGDTGFVVP